MSIHFLDSIDVPASNMMAIIDQLLQGEIAYRSQDYDTTIAHFERAVQIQDALSYTEPPFWYYPTRQSLGQALMDAGRPEDAESVYRKDLEQYPRNGWSMFGLARLLEAQGKDAESATAIAQFENLWQMTDVELAGSRL